MSEAVLSLSKYNQDFYAWALDQAGLLRAMQQDGTNTPLDLENLIEEVEGLASASLNAARSQLRRIIEHFLKLEYSPAMDPRTKWKLSVDHARVELDEALTPSIRRKLAEDLDAQYRKASWLAAGAMKEHGEAEAASKIPRACPYDFSQITAEDWYPEVRLSVDAQ